MPLPEKLPGRDIDGVDIVRHAGLNDDLLRPAARVDAPNHQRREQRMHLARLIVQLDLPEQLDILGVRSC